MLKQSTLLLAALSLAACSELTAPPEGPQYDVIGIAREVTVCKHSPSAGTATFSFASSNPLVGTNMVGATFSVTSTTSTSDLSGCVTVWRSVDPAQGSTILTITETSGTPKEIFVFSSGNTWPAVGSFDINGATVRVNVDFDNGATIRFTNDDQPPPPPPPPGGGQGCTPGYWKQSQHFDSWTAPYTPSTQFSAVFENAFPGKTLLQVLAQGGGGLNALGRHTVAALLNSASAGVDYDETTAGVISAFNAAFPGGDYETLKNRLEGFNEQGCPLN
jgi:hypothetical protein